MLPLDGITVVSLEQAMLDALGEWMTQPTYYAVYGDRPVDLSGAEPVMGDVPALGLHNDELRAESTCVARAVG